MTPASSIDPDRLPCGVRVLGVFFRLRVEKTGREAQCFATPLTTTN
jgi:hypothetical protein